MLTQAVENKQLVIKDDATGKTFTASEKRLYSETHWIAGTLDAVVEIEGKKYVCDFKTTSGIYDRTPFAQCAGYRLMLEEMGEKDFDGSVIVRIGKDGTFEEKFSYDYSTDKKIFLACLELYKGLKTF